MYKEGDMAMKDSSMRYRMILFVTGLCFSGFVFESATVFANPTASFRARKHNDTIVGTNAQLGDAAVVDNVSPGDTVEIDIYLSDWADVNDGTVRGFQVNLDCNSFQHDIETLCYFDPLGWDAPIVRQECLIKSQCSAGSSNPGTNCCGDDDCIGGLCDPSPQCPTEDYPLCNECPNTDNPPQCTGYNFDPSQGAFIKKMICSDGSNIGGKCNDDQGNSVPSLCPGGTCIVNTNFIFYNISPIIVDVSRPTPCNYGFGGLAFLACLEDVGTPRYVGTLILKAAANTTGTFHVGGIDTAGVSFIEGCDGLQSSLISDTVTINMVDPTPCRDEGCTITAVDPDNCAIDARYPWPPDDATTKLGWNSIDVSYAGICPSVFLPEDFAARFVGALGSPSITDVTDLGGQTLRLTFSPPVRPKVWACVDLFDANPIDAACIGAMPGDVNSNRTADADDVYALLGHLNNPTLSTWQCDADRSGSCQAGDLIGVIDMLNGGGAFTGWDGQSIGACPSPTP